MKQPKVGIGIIIQNKEGKILVGKRRNTLSPYYSIPGGHLEMGETFEATAIREVQEETGLIIQNPKVFCVTNNLETYGETGEHYVSVNLLCVTFEGEPALMEPEKCESWEWVSPEILPEPHFDASRYAVECYLKKIFYLTNQSNTSKTISHKSS